MRIRYSSFVSCVFRRHLCDTAPAYGGPWFDGYFLSSVLGVEELVLRCQWPGMPNEDSLKAVELFGREVLPHFG